MVEIISLLTFAIILTGCVLHINLRCAIPKPEGDVEVCSETGFGLIPMAAVKGVHEKFGYEKMEE